MSKHRFRTVLVTLCLAGPNHFAAAEATTIYVPEDVDAPQWVETRQAEQISSANSLTVYHEFSFSDKQPSSGIRFKHHFVDDAGRYYKAVHYDHGSAVAAADIDSDGMTDLYFVSQAGANALYRNLGNGRFEDITKRAGVASQNDIGVAASFADIDNDGDPDLYVTNVRSANRLFENLGSGRFRDISASSGLDYVEHSSGAVFFDYDRDGYLDVLVTVVGEYTTDKKLAVSGLPDRPEPLLYYLGHRDAFAGHIKQERLRSSRLFRNLGDGRFEDVTELTGLVDTSWSGDATPADFNNDGWPDIYLLNMQGDDQCWINEGGKRFRRASREIFPRTPWGSMGVKSFDFNNDGNMDLFLTDMHSDMSEKIGIEKEKLKATWVATNWTETFLRTEGRSIFGNAVYRNRGDGSFQEVSDQLGAENYWPWGLSVADINGDGWQDALLTSSMNYPFRYAPNTVLLNDSGQRFHDAEYLVGVEPRRGGKTSGHWFDLHCAERDQAHALCRGRQDSIAVHGALGSRSSVLFDLEGDGDIDIVTNEFGDVPQVLLSDLAERRKGQLRWLSIKLVGSRSNRDALGARVTVRTGAVQQTQVHDGKSGYLGQSSLPLYFGLGDAERIDTIEVQWPGGQSSSIGPVVELNQRLEIREVDARPSQ